MRNEPIQFSMPQGWTLEQSPEVVTIVGPEGDLKISFLELDSRENVQATALAAWKQLDPDFASKVMREAATPVEGNWDETHQIVYEVPASEARMEIAIVRKLGKRAFVNLIRGTTAAIGRRGAHLTEAVRSWKPAGYRETNLKDAVAPAWTEDHSRELKEFVLAAMAAAKVPGVSIAIVQGGQVVFEEGFGTRNMADQSPVTPKTRFMIGSTTKPLTTLLMAKLVDEKKLTWSTPLVDLLSEFSLADPAITMQLELRHTASASTGMPRQDMEFIFKYSGITPEQRIAQMKTMSPTTGFGETFQYSNFLVAAGGYAAARAYKADERLEEAYESALKEHVFEPLGMRDTFLRQEDALNGDAALPHAINFDGSVGRIPLDLEIAVYSVAPAGAAWSTGPDLARYILMELGKGAMPDGKRVISEEALLERRKKGVKIDQESFYGLGLFVTEQSGLGVIHHGGNTLGFSSDMFFLPEKGVGAAVLTNVSGANIFLAGIRQKIFEMLFGAELKSQKTMEAAAKLRGEGLAILRQKVATDSESLQWIGDLVGRYHCPELGSAEISVTKNASGDQFQIRFDEWESTLGSEIQAGGDRLIRMLSAPWSGSLRMLVQAGGAELLLDAGQRKYIFTRVQP